MRWPDGVRTEGMMLGWHAGDELVLAEWEVVGLEAASG